MITHRLHQVLVFALAAIICCTNAWPLMPGKHILREELTNIDKVLKCGVHEHLKMDHNHMITITAGDITQNNIYNATCDVTIRVALTALSTDLEKFGMKVAGRINFRDG